jgi:hypothetical protein
LAVTDVTASGQENVQGFKEAQAWERVVSGSAEKLRDSYFAQLKHRRRIETAQVVIDFLTAGLGLVVVLTSLFTAAWLILRGHSVEGTILGIVDLVGFFLAVFASQRHLGHRGAG